jgi:uncharacterized membrane protein
MTTIPRFLEILALGTWVGAILFLSFVIAPGAFATLPTRESAGAVVGMALTRLHILGYVAGVTALVARGFRLRPISAVVGPVGIAIVLMLVLTFASQQFVSARMADLRVQMAAAHGSIDATPKDDPLRAEFGRLHGLSTAAELAVLLLGLTALFFAVRSR